MFFIFYLLIYYAYIFFSLCQFYLKKMFSDGCKCKMLQRKIPLTYNSHSSLFMLVILSRMLNKLEHIHHYSS